MRLDVELDVHHAEVADTPPRSPMHRRLIGDASSNRRCGAILQPLPQPVSTRGPLALAGINGPFKR
eukprot:6239941-Pyramimonas_sp.AAC.1